ncbi:5-methylcytosine-specific restriction protein B [Vibrio crassostreae]|uniref:McrB family protein n=1 Tax=Vibrio crassostreae TaxID=246167 RepID=UPI000F48CE1A|nr:AAA family ATPase [Vibrio crassostreae]ROO75787.1 5-methylcytosine-specific restriction protein B [Vibrio crassostreae]ROP13794.1 5-methylcytosine-specific restriction protein B [Vibrio crassostreae]ROQ87882.1 5-methylcytosine-specific restriction protein B [Vibrio crassostreae]ROR87759.1 5-methylcytosine-specific restriction protein B [Vibrio crassostreae]RPE94968.1 5-methylcytosine-specific restriction protein B [Vibrio crassostreae]
MAIYCGDKNSSYLLENISEFNERSLIQGRSLFTELAVWNSLTCQELIDYFVENLDEGDGDFFEKLETQLADASPEAKVLASEMLWLMFLCPSNTGPESKRKSVERVFSWSGYEITPESRQRFLSDNALTGIGSAGTAYNTGRWRELVYVIRLVEALLKLSELERRELLKDVERLSKWLEYIPENGTRQFRHMFLYLLFPEAHERIFGNTDRKSILTTLADTTSAQYNRMDTKDADAKLLALRQSFEAEYGTQELDYYVEPLRSKWKEPKLSPANEVNDTAQEYDVKSNDKPQPLNTILYGPPGTGKTYNTINKALEIVDPEFYHQNNDDRAAIKKRFDELLNSNRIGFVTFHQSFSYEDFVEGLKATTENNQVNYEIEDGIFKSMCQKADKSKFSNFIIYRESFASFYVEDITDELIVFRKKNGNRLPIAREVIDEFCSAFENEKFDLSLDQKYWLKSFENRLEPYLITGFDSLYRDMLPKLLERRILQSATASKTFKEDTGRLVLIIDEINRGNISNIFGELITLIEPSKRAGGKEALSVKLPYSKEAFSVPDNLHIIGTMNTADKSLAQLDIALRRRFQFEEMMTNYELLATIPLFDGIDIKQMVETINKRIELLYDREHTIGHSFFLSLVEEPSIEKLSKIMELEILPLLEEYFFEDWERVAMVLGDHLKEDQSLRFVVEQFDANEVAQLMGDDWDQTGIQPYVRNDQAFNAATAYIGIYS